MPSLTDPEAWLPLLDGQLRARQPHVKRREDYYNGRHRLAFATAKFKEAFGALFGTFADNWCQIVVDASVERLRVEGFRFGPDQQADKDAWAIWQANNLDAESVILHSEAVKCGEAYWLVAPPLEDGQKALITVEHAAQMTVAYEPGNRRVRRAALKEWVDDEGFLLATVYLPDTIFRYRSEKPLTGPNAVGYQPDMKWVARNDDIGASVDNPLGVVPVIPVRNNPSLLAGGRSDLEPAMPLQDAINKLVLDMMVASEYAAYPQRVLTGVEVPEEDGRAQSEKAAAISRTWYFENENADVKTFTAADLNNYVKAFDALIRHLAAQTRTPPHYLLGEIVNASGDALKAAETGLVAKVRRKQTDFAEAHEEAIRLAFKAQGDSVPDGASAETIWGDPEYRSEGEMVDAAVKLRSLGLPLEMLWERIGLSPQQIEKAKNLAGLPDRPPAGATTADVPPVLGGASSNGTAQQ